MHEHVLRKATTQTTYALVDHQFIGLTFAQVRNIMSLLHRAYCADHRRVWWAFQPG